MTAFSFLKYAAYFVLFLNAGSLPFVWHIRVFWRLALFTLEYRLLCLRLSFASEKARARALLTWAEGLSPTVGANPFEVHTTFRRWTTIDDIDMFGFHLSNSSYAKAFDAARIKAAVRVFPTWARVGGYLPLAATHYHFIREIPPFTRYEVRLSLGSWDDKWIYVVARYVTRPSRRLREISPKSTSVPSTPNDNNPTACSQNGSVNVEQVVATMLHGEAGKKRPSPTVEPDGAIVHCVAVAQLCFKLGRITVPPAIVLASEGFTKPHEDSDKSARPSQSYSRHNPPPNWIRSQAMWLPRGGMDDFRAFLGGKWRDVPEGERWWEDALGGSIEARRKTNLDVLESLKQGMEGAKMVR